MNTITHELEKVINDDSYILILGSVPSVLSRKYHFYYMNPTNRFYKILASLLDERFLDNDIEVKKELFKKHHIALYDVIEKCDINGSSDASIKNVVPSDIKKLIKDYPIKKIFLNGKKAYDLFIKYNKDLSDLAILLPSSSAANAASSLDKLIDKWKVILEYID